jgi:hypothetical protein
MTSKITKCLSEGGLYQGRDLKSESSDGNNYRPAVTFCDISLIMNEMLGRTFGLGNRKTAFEFCIPVPSRMSQQAYAKKAYTVVRLY